MNRDQKAAVVDQIAGELDGAQAIFAVDYRGITVPQAAALRAQLREVDASFRIVKNSLTERAADKAGAEPLKELLDGPTALTFVRGDAALAAKALSEAGRETQVLAFKGGLMDGAAVSADEILAISRLPAREVLHSQLVGTIAAPLTGLARGLGSLLGGIAIQLQAIADQGLVSGAAPAAETDATEATEAESDGAAGVDQSADGGKQGDEGEAAPEPAGESGGDDHEAGAATADESDDDETGAEAPAKEEA